MSVTRRSGRVKDVRCGAFYDRGGVATVAHSSSGTPAVTIARHPAESAPWRAGRRLAIPQPLRRRHPALTVALLPTLL